MRDCKRCGKETEYYNLCSCCISIVAIQMVDSGRSLTKGEAVEKLYDDELDRWYAFKGY